MIAPGSADILVNDWVAAQGGGKAEPGTYVAIGDWDLETKGWKGGLVFYRATSETVWVNIAIRRGSNPRLLLGTGLWYVFAQLSLPRLTFSIRSTNLSSIRLAQKLGAAHEATLHGIEPGCDTLFYQLSPDQCNLWRKLRGQRSRGNSPESRLLEAPSATRSEQSKAVPDPA